MMTGEEVDWLNDYHRRVAEKLMPLLTDEADRQWLRKATEKYSL
jgi:Xaa-Pro aminopeptidase